MGKSLYVFTAMSALLSMFGCGPQLTPVDPPKYVMVYANIEPDDTKATKASRAVNVVDMDTDKVYNFPLSDLTGPGTPIDGQPMHTILAPEKKRMWFTVGGDDKVPLRVVALKINWSKEKGATVEVTKVVQVLPTNTANVAGKPVQQGHGSHFGKDDSVFYFSELLNNRVRIYNTKTDTINDAAISDEVFKTPHGFYPNKSGTLAASTQYEFNGTSVGIWNLSGDKPTLVRKILLQDGDIKGAYTHTARWLDDKRFYTNTTQEIDQGLKDAQHSVWLVDAEAGTAKVVLKPAAVGGDGSDGVLVGVSDTLVSNNKLYVAEGNVERTDPAGHVSIWNVADPLKPTFIKRLSENKGLPDKFRDTHELDRTPDGKFVVIQSFRSSHTLKVDVATDTVVKSYEEGTGHLQHHGLHLGWLSNEQ